MFSDLADCLTVRIASFCWGLCAGSREDGEFWVGRVESLAFSSRATVELFKLDTLKGFAFFVKIDCRVHFWVGILRRCIFHQHWVLWTLLIRYILKFSFFVKTRYQEHFKVGVLRRLNSFYQERVLGANLNRYLLDRYLGGFCTFCQDRAQSVTHDVINPS